MITLKLTREEASLVTTFMSVDYEEKDKELIALQDRICLKIKRAWK